MTEESLRNHRFQLFSSQVCFRFSIFVILGTLSRGQEVLRQVELDSYINRGHVKHNIKISGNLWRIYSELPMQVKQNNYHFNGK